ncbi:helix-turn-helix transcriptional regulator [Lachnospiraceae bacterium 48-33]
MTVGEKIKKYRKEKGLTQKKLGELCGINEANIRKYELGKANPKIETIEKIANALNVQIIDIVPQLLTSPEYRKTDEWKSFEKGVDTTYAIVKILEDLYNRAEIIDVGAYNDDELQYSSSYFSLGNEPHKIVIEEGDFDKIKEQLKNNLKASIELIAKDEICMLDKWINEDTRINKLILSESEHVEIALEDTFQKKIISKNNECIQNDTNEQTNTENHFDKEYASLMAAYSNTNDPEELEKIYEDIERLKSFSKNPE